MAGDVEPGESAVGVADDHAAAVGWVGVAADDSQPLELVDDLCDRLACDVCVGGEFARTSAALAEVAQDLELSGEDVAVAASLERYADLGVDRMTVAVRSKTIPDVREELLRFGDEVIATTADL